MLLFVIDCPYEDQPDNFTAVEGYITTLLLEAYDFYKLSIPYGVYILFPHSQTRLWVDEQVNRDCECWATSGTFCYHNVNSSSNPEFCCRSKILVHIVTRVDETGILYIWYNKSFTYQVAVSISK